MPPTLRYSWRFVGFAALATALAMGISFMMHSEHLAAAGVAGMVVLVIYTITGAIRHAWHFGMVPWMYRLRNGRIRLWRLALGAALVGLGLLVNMALEYLGLPTF